MAQPRGALRGLERVLGADGNHDRSEEWFARSVVANRQRLGSFECLPIAGRRGGERRQRRASMPPIEIDMRIHQPVNAVDNRLEAAAFDGQIVLETPRHPDSTHFLEEQDSQASWLHGCHVYRSQPPKQQ